MQPGKQGANELYTMRALSHHSQVFSLCANMDYKCYRLVIISNTGIYLLTKISIIILLQLLIIITIFHIIRWSRNFVSALKHQRNLDRTINMVITILEAPHRNRVISDWTFPYRRQSDSPAKEFASVTRVLNSMWEKQSIPYPLCCMGN